MPLPLTKTLVHGILVRFNIQIICLMVLLPLTKTLVHGILRVCQLLLTCLMVLLPLAPATTTCC